MAKNTAATLDELLDAPIVWTQIDKPAPLKEAPKTAPVKTEPVKTAPVKTAPVKTPPATSAPTVLTVDGFTISLMAGAFSETVKTATTRATTNVWYPIVAWLDTQPMGYLTITRSADSKAKSPVAAIKSARNRGLDHGLKTVHKMSVLSSATKGTWYLVKR